MQAIKELSKILSKYEDQILFTSVAQRFIQDEASKEDYLSYLKAAYFYVSHTCPKLEEAGRNAQKKGSKIADYYFEHAKEELGHEKIILSDLKVLGVSEESLKDYIPPLGARAMVASGYYLANHESPLAFLGEILTIEGLSEKRASYFADLIRKRIGVGKDATKFLDSHGSLDIDHTEELRQVVEEFLTKPEQLATVIESINLIYPLYVQMLSELTKGETKAPSLLFKVGMNLVSKLRHAQ